MARKSKERSRKPYIIVFWEGESEAQYMKFMRSEFREKVNLVIHPVKGVFHTLKKAFSLRGKYSDEILDVDEIWLVFDTEQELHPQWEDNWGIVKSIKKKCKNSKVRLLMTKGCIEYFFLLHYEKMAPMISCRADKEELVLKLAGEKYCPGYKKGDKKAISLIARRYEQGISEGTWCLQRLEDELTKARDEDDKYQILYFSDSTFTNVHEAIAYLRDL